MMEIDEAEYKRLQSIAGFVQKGLANPKTRSKILEAQKELNPEAIIPELDATKPVYEKINAVSEQVSTLAKQIADDKVADKEARDKAHIENQWRAGRDRALQAGYTAEGLEALEKFMVEKGIIDHEVAMPAFEKMHPPEKMISHTSDRFDPFTGAIPSSDEDDTKLLLEGKESAFLNKRIASTLASVRGR